MYEHWQEQQIAVYLVYLLDGFLNFSPKDHANFEHICSHMRGTCRTVISLQYKFFCCDCFWSRMLCKNEGGTMEVIPHTLLAKYAFRVCGMTVSGLTHEIWRREGDPFLGKQRKQ